MPKRSEYEKLTPEEVVEYHRIWNLGHRDIRREKDRALYPSVAKRISEQRKHRRALNLEADRKYHRDYYQRKLEENRKYQREWKRKRRITHPEKMRAIENNNYKNNPERYIEKNRKRKARKLGGDVVDCSAKIELLNRERFCHWCCIRLTDDNRSIDHVIPLARGGKHIPDNLVAACRKCNSSKQHKLLEEWTWELAA